METQETKALTVAQPHLTPGVWQMIETVAPTVWRAGLFGAGSVEAAASIMLKGHELGLGLTSSFEFIHVVQGKPTLSPRGALALIHQSGELAELKIEDIAGPNGPSKCRVTMKRVNGFEYTTEFSMEDAERAGVVKDQSGWSKYPANMLRWRAVGFCADVVFPDVLCGMKRADEFGAEISPEGDVIEGNNWNVVEVIQKADPTLQELLSKYGATAIMDANGGKIPGNEEEIKAVAGALGAYSD